MGASLIGRCGLAGLSDNDMGTATCGKYPGECKDEVCTLPGYMTVDAETYASWGISSLKMDGCNSIHTHAILDPAYEFMGAALNKTGRPILYSCANNCFPQIPTCSLSILTDVTRCQILAFLLAVLTLDLLLLHALDWLFNC